MKTIKYYYPVLSDKDLGWFRIGGPGLANCMFFAVNAYISVKNDNLGRGGIISPTWRKFSLGPILRKERDKRVYNSLFNDLGVNGIKKAWIILTKKLFDRKDVKMYHTLGKYFQDLNKNVPLVQEYFNLILKEETVKSVDVSEMREQVAVHIRLGDYIPEMRVDIEWYKKLIENILREYPKQKFALFSDGSDEELSLLLSLPNVKRCFFGNAFADMWAISKTKFVIASDSTFSAWGAFLGQRPIVFSKRHFPPVYAGQVPEAVIGKSTILPSVFKKYLEKQTIVE